MTDFEQLIIDELRILKNENKIDHRLICDRLSELEKFKWKAVGGIAALAAIIQIVTQFIKLKG